MSLTITYGNLKCMSWGMENPHIIVSTAQGTPQIGLAIGQRPGALALCQLAKLVENERAARQLSPHAQVNEVSFQQDEHGALILESVTWHQVAHPLGR